MSIGGRDSRQRVLRTLEHKEPDRVPLDLGGSVLTGMHASSVYRLRQALRLDPPGAPVKVADTYQMLMLGGRRIVTQITSRMKKHLKAGEDCNAGCLSAPMHGLVVDVPVHEGDTVEKGQTLVVLESMKMQMQLRSPRPGKISKVAVQPGNQVEKGALLVQFE